MFSELWFYIKSGSNDRKGFGAEFTCYLKVLKKVCERRAQKYWHWSDPGDAPGACSNGAGHQVLEYDNSTEEHFEASKAT